MGDPCGSNRALPAPGPRRSRERQGRRTRAPACPSNPILCKRAAFHGQPARDKFGVQMMQPERHGFNAPQQVTTSTTAMFIHLYTSSVGVLYQCVEISVRTSDINYVVHHNRR